MMVDLDDIKQAAHVATDQSGKPVVQIPLELWQEWLGQGQNHSTNGYVTHWRYGMKKRLMCLMNGGMNFKPSLRRIDSISHDRLRTGYKHHFADSASPACGSGAIQSSPDI
ncbi:MAG: hypothetical protein IT324_29560 [Anaerolineae bacterium]|nr:hypothetical protein [Anaerolineae bacterium]